MSGFGSHAHEESALIAIVISVLIGVIDLFVDVWDGHGLKVLGYFGLFFVAYLVARIFRNRAWE